MRELVLDLSAWKTKADVYDSLSCRIGAPPCHGRNPDALSDSVLTGQINKIEVPYRLVMKNSRAIAAPRKAMLGDFVKLIHELAAEGCPVEIRVENTN
jgi:RNAse (barnase) inhibitor barstar